MKTIGFISYYMSECHANNYPKCIKDISAETGEDFVLKYAWAEKYVSPVDGRNTDEWCAEFGCEKCETIAELCEKADYIMVLSPSNPETHLGYAQEVLKYKKLTYIDKTFAPDYATATKIFEIAKNYGAKFFSSSALRFATEIAQLPTDGTAMMIIGGGSNIEEYLIHQLEILVKLTDNSTPKRVKVEGYATQRFCTVEFEDGKMATIIYAMGLGYTVCIDKGLEENPSAMVRSDTFKCLLRDVLRFFKTGETSFDVNQTLTIMKLRDTILNANKSLGEWVNF